jgi:hypothetical protein
MRPPDKIRQTENITSLVFGEVIGLRSLKE